MDLHGITSEEENISENEYESSKLSVKKRARDEESDAEDSEQESDSEDENQANEENEDINSAVDYDGNFKFEATENPKPLTPEDLAKFTKDLENTGVVYMSHIPPYMKPIKVRQLLSQYAEIGRIYLAPEDPKVTARRKKYRKIKKINYIEGWIEFMDKKMAKKVVGMLNAQNMGGKKRDFYHDDIWNLKYLPKFKWNHLTEQLSYERAVKEQKLRTEMSMARKINKEYVKNVEQRKQKKKIESGEPQQQQEQTTSLKPPLKIRQRKVVDQSQRIDDAKKSVLSKIFT
jgi:ESF2/ABP1 family protein